MSKACELTNSLDKILSEIDAELQRQSDECSRIDGLREDLLHLIENTSLNAYQGYQCAKALQLVSQKRRFIKNELQLLESLKARVSPIRKIKDKMDAKKQVQDELVTKGILAYTPRIITELDKDTILDTVQQLLHE